VRPPPAPDSAAACAPRKAISLAYEKSVRCAFELAAASAARASGARLRVVVLRMRRRPSAFSCSSTMRAPLKPMLFELSSSKPASAGSPTSRSKAAISPASSAS
jgi:hypothetical protein